MMLHSEHEKQVAVDGLHVCHGSKHTLMKYDLKFR